MSAVPWTKFQDFYLRYGFLKVIVAALDPDRRSLSADLLLRRATRTLLPRVGNAPGPRSGRKEDVAKVKGSPVVEALLRAGDCPSFVYAITEPTGYKMIDWARDAELLGRGNKITERGLLLRSFQDDDATDRFLSGEVDAWNPFSVDPQERWFLLYHLLEIDPVTDRLLEGIAATEPGTIIETADAAGLFARAFVAILNEAESTIRLSDIPDFRTAKALAGTIAEELDLTESLRPSAPWLGERDAGPRKRSPSGRERKGHKNADHQTIPRFEQLCDLGMLVKPPASGGRTEESERKRWRYVATPLCRAWVEARRRQAAIPFAWTGFAATRVAASGGHASKDLEHEVDRAARRLEAAFHTVGRPMGMTPFDTLGLRAMLDAAEDGEILEMDTLSRVLLAAKRSGVAQDRVYFASGNAIDQLFVQIRPGFAEEISRSADIVTAAMRAE